MALPDHTRSPRDRRRVWIAGAVVAAVVFWLGMSFAAVPLYRKFCQATGFSGTTQVATGPSAARGARTLTVRFDANVAPGLPWRFEPDTPVISLQTGKTATVYFKVTNTADHATAADAKYNVSPDVAGLYFDKIACFCFTRQTLGPKESMDMPVVFFLDPDLENDETMAAIDTLTLSYTFFAAKPGSQPFAEAVPAGGAGPKSKL